MLRKQRGSLRDLILTKTFFCGCWLRNANLFFKKGTLGRRTDSEKSPRIKKGKVVIDIWTWGSVIVYMEFIVLPITVVKIFCRGKSTTNHRHNTIYKYSRPVSPCLCQCRHKSKYNFTWNGYRYLHAQLATRYIIILVELLLLSAQLPLYYTQLDLDD